MMKMLSFLYMCVHAQCHIHFIHHLEFYFRFKVSCGMAVKVKRYFFRYYTNFLLRGWGGGGEKWVADFPPIFDIVFFFGSSSFLTSSSLFRLSSFLRSSYFIRSSSSSSMLDAWWDPSYKSESTNYMHGHGHLDKQKLDTE